MSDPIESRSPAANLKSASGAGFSFEDKVAALLFAEVLAGVSSLGADNGAIERIERQAVDWEPLGDLLLTVSRADGGSSRCACSVKSNRQFNTNGCNPELRDGLWAVLKKPLFNQKADRIAVFCSELSNQVSPPLNQLCRQARAEARPNRLEEKVDDQKHRKIYDSLRHPSESGEQGFPWQILSRLVLREFDFEDATSRNEAAAFATCRQVIVSDEATDEQAMALWRELLTFASELRDAGGSATRESLIRKLRNKFRLRGDPLDVSAWSAVRSLSDDWLGQIDTTLSGGLILPRATERGRLREKLETGFGCHIIGESGSGKSALVKSIVAEHAAGSTEIIWIKSDQFLDLVAKVPDFEGVLRRTRATSGLLVFDALDGCYSERLLDKIGRVVSGLRNDPPSPWKVVFVCQTPDWSRVSRRLVKTIAGHDGLVHRVECGDLSKDDMSLVYRASPSIHRLALQGGLQRALASPKMLDLLLRGQLAEDITLAGEADLVEWWWQETIMAGKRFSAEESVARNLAVRMASELVTEVSPDSAEGPAEFVDALIHKRVLRRTHDGRLRFDHDLLADWSRVMHLRALGDQVVTFMRANAENPPWLRAIRLFSHHLLERRSDIDRWRSILGACEKTKKSGEDQPASDLQVLDVWLEGIAHCNESRKVLETLRAEMFASDAWLLRRLLGRMLHDATIPDPVLQQRFANFDPESAEIAARHFRLPVVFLWNPVLEFLVAYPNAATDFIPLELAEVAKMWARLEEYLGSPWPKLADLVILNGEKELRREVAGKHRHDRHAIRPGGGSASRIAIYAGSLLAASQHPDRVARLALKGAGRLAWDKADLTDSADKEWHGEFSYFGSRSSFGSYVVEPLQGWAEGPTRRASRDLCHAWFDEGAGIALFRKNPQVACEVTLALLIDWPRRGVRRGDHSMSVEQHGFRFEPDLHGAFWTKGPFLTFLRQNWQPALGLIIRLVNFATERYGDWWSYEPGVVSVEFKTAAGAACWKGTRQVYAWNLYHMNTPSIVSSALMALEKWLDEQLHACRPIAKPVERIYSEGQSLAFAGVLISIGKRHPEEFIDDLKPLLFDRQIYLFDLEAVNENLGLLGAWPGGKAVNELRVEWNNLQGRRRDLKNLCCEWLVTRSDVATVLGEVCAAWRNEAENLPSEESEKRIQILRWASDFDMTTWRQVTLPDGRIGWQSERPQELQDLAIERDAMLTRELWQVPQLCTRLIESGDQLSEVQLEDIWRRLRDWEPYQQVAATAQQKHLSFAFAIDHRDARSALLAVLMCLGRDWLAKDPQRRLEVEGEIHKILSQPLGITAFSEYDSHDDREAFLGRCCIHGWLARPENPECRKLVGMFVAAHRYRTVRHLFSEAFRLRKELGSGYGDLEGLALSFAVARREATKLVFMRNRREIAGDVLQQWYDQWLPKFATGQGPVWVEDWSKIEKGEDFPPKSDQSYGTGHHRYELHRRAYGLDIDVVLAAFGSLPALAEATSSEERAHWLNIARQVIGAFCRTLPVSESEDEEWSYEPWRPDEAIFELTARRLFECSRDERTTLWQPILSLPPAAHHHVAQFLNAVLAETWRDDPPRTKEIVSIWQELADYLFHAEKWNKYQSNTEEVWKVILLYGAPFTAVREPIFVVLVEALRPLFEWHIKCLTGDAYEQSSLASYLASAAGNVLLPDALVWLGRGWETASAYFWEIAVGRGQFDLLLRHVWHAHYDSVRANADALKAFKTLTLNLATRHVPGALDIQQQLGREQ